MGCTRKMNERLILVKSSYFVDPVEGRLPCIRLAVKHTSSLASSRSTHERRPSRRVRSAATPRILQPPPNLDLTSRDDPPLPATPPAPERIPPAPSPDRAPHRGRARSSR